MTTSVPDKNGCCEVVLAVKLFLPSGQILEMQVTSRETIRGLKRKIARRVDVSHFSPSIVYGSVRLDDYAVVTDYAKMDPFPEWCIISDCVAAESVLLAEVVFTVVLSLLVCGGCGAIAKRMKRCGNCREHYCSRACQVSRWHSHKDLCGHEQQSEHLQE